MTKCKFNQSHFDLKNNFNILKEGVTEDNANLLIREDFSMPMVLDTDERYSPILFNISGAASMGAYALTASVASTSTITSPTYTVIASGSSNYWESNTLGTLWSPYPYLINIETYE